MRADGANLLRFLKNADQLVVPLYQRRGSQQRLLAVARVAVLDAQLLQEHAQGRGRDAFSHAGQPEITLAQRSPVPAVLLAAPDRLLGPLGERVGAAAPLADEPSGCAEDSVGEVRSLGRTLARWRTEILNRHLTGASNGPTEGLNLLVKKVKRAGHGFRSFANYRLRILLHAGGVRWTETRPPTPTIRSRSPH